MLMIKNYQVAQFKKNYLPSGSVATSYSSLSSLSSSTSSSSLISSSSVIINELIVTYSKWLLRRYFKILNGFPSIILNKEGWLSREFHIAKFSFPLIFPPTQVSYVYQMKTNHYSILKNSIIHIFTQNTNNIILMSDPAYFIIRKERSDWFVDIVWKRTSLRAPNNGGEGASWGLSTGTLFVFNVNAVAV